MVDATVVGFGDAFGSGVWFQTCFLLDAQGYRVAVGFSASSLIALNYRSIPTNSKDAVVLTYLHEITAGVCRFTAGRNAGR